ncbi:dicarboxylate/amino acid:cation symporter, partial [Erwinia amylovora]|nr:dicarboxylate/amino acid:cation symporter [Erwinia amylovora]
MALILGLASTHLFNVGQCVDIAMFQDSMNQHKSPDSLTPISFLTYFIQNTLINPFIAFSDGNVLAVVLFALLLGL